jgi:hypothetical protein
MKMKKRKWKKVKLCLWLGSKPCAWIISRKDLIEGDRKCIHLIVKYVDD